MGMFDDLIPSGSGNTATADLPATPSPTPPDGTLFSTTPAATASPAGMFDDLIPSNSSAAGVAGFQAKAGAYDDYLSDALTRGEPEQQARAEAEQYSEAASLRTLPEMVSFLGTGKIASGVVTKLLSSETPAAVRALVGVASATGGNAAAGTVNQLAEQAATGKPLDASYSLERGVQDTLFGLHGGLSGAHGGDDTSATSPQDTDAAPTPPDGDNNAADAAQPPSTADQVTNAFNGMGDAAQAAGQLRAIQRMQGGEDVTFQGRAADAARANPAHNTTDNADGSVSVVGVKNPNTGDWHGTAPVDFTPDDDTTPATFATGDTPEQRAQSFLQSSDGAPVTAARFEQGEEVPASLSRFPQAEQPDGGTVVYDPGVHNPEDFTGPVDFTPNDQSNDPATDTTSTANAVTDAARIKRGFAPADVAARRDFGRVWDNAKATLTEDPTAGQRLVEELKAKPRALNDTENALLLHQQIAAQAEHTAAVEAVNTAPDDAARIAAQVRLARADDALYDTYQVTKAAGAETGRGLNARKMLAAQDYSLSNMLNRRRAANDGKPLTDTQSAEVQQAHAKVAEAQAKLNAHGAMVDDLDSAMAGAPPTNGDPDWTVGSNGDASAEAQHRADLDREAREGISNAGGVELLDAVRAAGGLPTDDPVYRGELHTIREAHAPVAQAGRTGTFNLFRNNAPKIDELTSRLRERGFDVETPDDALIRVAGHQMPHWATHLMILEPAQFGSTMVRVARSMVKKTGEQKGYTEGAFQAALAPINNGPVVNSVTRLQRDSKMGGAQQVASNLVQGLVPGFVRDLAEDTDKHTSDGDPVPRAPKTVLDSVKQDIPGLRESLDAKFYRGISDQKRQKIEDALRQ